MMVGTYLLVKVIHIPTRCFQPSALSKEKAVTYLSNFANDSAPIVCRCSSTVAVDLLRPQPCRCFAKITHGRRGHPESWIPVLILLQPTRQSMCRYRTWVGRGLPLGKSSSSFVSWFKASNSSRSVCFRFEAPRLFRGVVVPSPIKEGGVTI